MPTAKASLKCALHSGRQSQSWQNIDVWAKQPNSLLRSKKKKKTVPKKLGKYVKCHLELNAEQSHDTWWSTWCKRRFWVWCLSNRMVQEHVIIFFMSPFLLTTLSEGLGRKDTNYSTLTWYMTVVICALVCTTYFQQGTGLNWMQDSLISALRATIVRRQNVASLSRWNKQRCPCKMCVVPKHLCTFQH